MHWSVHLCLYLIWFYLSKFSMWSVFTTYIIHNYLKWCYLSKFSMWWQHIIYTTISYASISFLCGHDIYYIQLFHMQVTILIILSQFIFPPLLSFLPFWFIWLHIICCDGNGTVCYVPLQIIQRDWRGPTYSIRCQKLRTEMVTYNIYSWDNGAFISCMLYEFDPM